MFILQEYEKELGSKVNMEKNFLNMNKTPKLALYNKWSRLEGWAKVIFL